jgi:DnaK suppressor protein
MRNRDEIRRALTARRDSLLPQMRAWLDEENRLLDTKEPEWQDLSTQQREAMLLDRLSETELLRWREVESALRRIDLGTYGTCSACGEEIDERRLAVLPEAATCRDCGEDAEKQAGRRPRA